jgi:uncharacterized protein
MILDLSDLPPEGVAFDHAVTIPDRADTVDDRPLLQSGQLRGTAVPAERGIELRARLDARVCLGCSRCLEPFDHDLTSDVDLMLVAGPDEPGADDGDASTVPIEGTRVDLNEIAREQILLGLPLKPVCTPACRGLCPSCGTHRNRLECGCRADDPDPRLAPLRELLSRMR